MGVLTVVGVSEFLIVSQRSTLRGFALDGDHEEAISPVGGQRK